MSFDWDSCTPRQLAAEADLSDLITAARGLDAWTQRAAEVVDYVLRARLVRMLGVEWSEAELRALQRSIEKIDRPRLRPSLEALDVRLGTRWNLMREFVDDCVDLLRARAP